MRRAGCLRQCKDVRHLCESEYVKQLAMLLVYLRDRVCQRVRQDSGINGYVAGRCRALPCRGPTVRASPYQRIPRLLHLHSCHHIARIYLALFFSTRRFFDFLGLRDERLISVSAASASTISMARTDLVCWQ